MQRACRLTLVTPGSPGPCQGQRLHPSVVLHQQNAPACELLAPLPAAHPPAEESSPGRKGAHRTPPPAVPYPPLCQVITSGRPLSPLRQVINIPQHDVARGEVAVEYMPPEPARVGYPQGCLGARLGGPHRGGRWPATPSSAACSLQPVQQGEHRAGRPNPLQLPCMSVLWVCSRRQEGCLRLSLKADLIATCLAHLPGCRAATACSSCCSSRVGA